VISRLNLARNRRETVASGRVCGSPLAVHGDRYLVLAASRLSLRGFGGVRPQRLRVIDLEHPGSGERVRRLGAPLDALAVGGSGRLRHPSQVAGDQRVDLERRPLDAVE